MTKTVAVLNRFHSKLAKGIGDKLGYQVSIKAVAEGWEAYTAGRQLVRFAMYPADQEGSSLVNSARGRGDILAPSRAFSSVLEPCPWIAWCDVWWPTGNGTFVLDSAGWTFFWGLQVRAPVQLFRAEWVNLEHKVSEAPQPHWHFDKELLCEELPAAAASAGSADPADLISGQGLPESAAGHGPDDVTARILSLSGVHLGMAGWTNSQEHPGCWQAPMRDENALLCWAIRTLEHTCSELPRLRTD
jgi:hypothetical protein